MIEPQVEHGGASSWFWIVESGVVFAAAGAAGDSSTREAAAPLDSSSSRPFTPA